MNELVDLAVSEISQKMDKAIEHCQRELAAVRTSRPSPALLDRIELEYYGTMVSLNKLAGFHVSDARTLVVTPFDKASLGLIDKAILNSDLGITPNNDGQVIRLVFPPLNEERRKELVKLIKQICEDAKVALRNLRRNARHEIEAFEKTGEISKDDLTRSEKDLDGLVHEKTALVDKLLASKEKELMEI
jgi:ribosome recycling factor